MKRFIAVLTIAAAFVTNSSAQDFTLFSGSTTNSLTKLVVNGTIQLSPIDHGSYGVDGLHDPSNDSFSVGLCVPCVHGPELRNWFAFDISSLTAPVTSLSLTLKQPAIGRSWRLRCRGRRLAQKAATRPSVSAHHQPRPTHLLRAHLTDVGRRIKAVPLEDG